MHRGVREFVAWMEQHRDDSLVTLQSPAQSKDIEAIEHHMGSPLPADLRFVLGRFNGAVTPAGTLLAAAPGPGSTIEAALKEVAELREASFLDPEVLLPFHRTEHGSVLAFDRSAAPISDTWPIVDFDPSTGEVRLVHRTFDGWCRLCVGEWNASDFRDPFTLDKYLRQGLRHVEIESDVSIAHVTVGHALRRAGQARAALDSYLRGARCVPAIPWADWEALKLAYVLRDEDAMQEAAGRISTRTPAHGGELRGTTPSRVAFIVARHARALEGEARAPYVRAMDHLRAQVVDEDDGAALRAIADAMAAGSATIPLPDPPQDTAVPDAGDVEARWAAMREAYAAGALRDDDLALDPSYDAVAAAHDLGELVHIRRDF